MYQQPPQQFMYGGYQHANVSKEKERKNPEMIREQGKKGNKTHRPRRLLQCDCKSGSLKWPFPHDRSTYGE
jgi:hypothetical protein